MPDVFDFLSTRIDTSLHTPLNVQTPIHLGSSFMPTVPADARTNTPTMDMKSLLDGVAAKVAALPKTAPIYEIGNKDQKRYSNPNMQYTPGYDMEDIYGVRQSGWNKAGNALVKTGINFGSTFVSHFAMMPHTLDLIRSGKYLDAFQDDSLFSYAQSWITNAEDEFPNYYTAWEREHPFLSVIPFSGGALNFYGDKLIKNIGFSMGALASGLVTDAALEVATMGTATPVVVANRLRSLAQMMPRFYRAMRSFNKIATSADEFKDVMGMSGTAKQMVKNLGTYKGAMNASRFAATSYLTAQTEAHIEGYHNYIDIKTKKYEDAIRNNDYNPSTYEAIEKEAQDAARWTTGLNMPIIMASNFFQFKNLLHGRANFGESMKGFIDVDMQDGLKLVNTYSKAKKWKAFGKKLGLDMLSEGGQEAGQAITGNTVYDYYTSKLSPETRGSLLSHMLKELPNSIDQSVLEEAFIGAISGAGMGSIGGWNKYSNERTQKIVDQQNRTIEKFQSTAQQMYHQMEIMKANTELEKDPDNIQKLQNLKEAKTQALFTTIHDSLYFGTYDALMDSFNDLRDIDLDDFNQSFDHNFTEAERQGFVDTLIQDSKQMKTNVEAVNKAFNKNPFESNVFVSRIKKSFFPADSEIEGIQTKLFNDFKQNMAYSLTRMQKVEGNLFEFDQELTKLGVNPDFLEYIQGDASIFNKKKGASNYMKWKSTFLNTLKDQQKYYDKLSTLNAPDLANSKQEKAKLDGEIQRLEAYIQNINEAIEANDLEKVASLIEKEEVSSEVQMYDVFRKAIEARRIEMEAAKKREEEVKNPEKVQEAIIAANELNQEDVEPAEVGETSILTKPAEWTDEFGGYQGDLLINGRRFKIRAIKDGQLHVVPEGGKEIAIVTKQGDVYTMEYGRAPNNVIEEVTIEKVPLEEVPQEQVEKAANSIIGSTETVQPVETTTTTTTTTTPITPTPTPKVEAPVIKVKDIVGREVMYNGEKYLVKQEYEKFTLENKTSIVDLESGELDIASKGITVIEPLAPLISKYNIKNVTETSVTVNGVDYTIETDKNGNIKSLSPVSNPEQKIKNEKLITAVEIERNKLDFNSQKELEQLDNYEKEVEEILTANLDINVVLDGIFSINMTDNVAEALDKLYDQKPLTQAEQLSLSLWLTDVFDRISRLIKKDNTPQEREATMNAYNTAEIIHSLLYNLTNVTLNENETRPQKGMDTETKGNVSTKKSKGRVKKEIEEKAVETKKVDTEERKQSLESAREIETLYDLRVPIPEDSKETLSKIKEVNKLLKKIQALDQQYSNETDEEERIRIYDIRSPLQKNLQALEQEIMESRRSVISNTPIFQAIKSAYSAGQKFLNKIKLAAKSNEWTSSMPISKEDFYKLQDAVKRLSVKSSGEVTSNSEIIPDILIVEELTGKYDTEINTSELTSQPAVNTFTLDQIKQSTPGMIFYEENKPTVGYTMREKGGEKVLTKVTIKDGGIEGTRYHTVKAGKEPAGPFLQLEAPNFVPLTLEQKADVLEIDEVSEFLGKSKGRDYKNLKALMKNGDIDIECN